MMKLTIQLGDNDNRNYKRVVELELPNLTALSIKNVDRFYDEAWDILCDTIEETFTDLPRNWFIDKLTF